MSYQEKRNVVSVASSLLLLAAYCIYAFGRAGMANLDNLKFWANTMLIFIGIGVVAMIVVQIVFHILLSVAMAVKQKIGDETCDDKKIEQALKSDMAEDEMGKLIELKANRIGYAVVSAGFVAGLVSIALGASAAVMLNIAFLSCLVGSVVDGLMQMRYYRRGV